MIRDDSPDAAEVAKAAIVLLRGLAHDTDHLRRPAEKGQVSRSQQVLPLSVVAGTRTYLEALTHQINGSYAKGWYDACGVMMRRLVETLIIEVYEACGMATKIQDPSGNFVPLESLIGKIGGESSSWHLSRGTKRALAEVKELGDNSAHSRRFNAHRGDVDNIKGRFRVAVQELVRLSGLG